MGNYKAKETAKNMQITDDNKKQLVRLMIFATMLGNNIDESEAHRTISIASEWRTDISKDIKTIKSFRTLKKGGWLEKQNLSDIIAILVDILSASDFFDIQNTLTATLQKYSLDFAKRDPNATPELASKIKFSTLDFACQFYEDNGEKGKREVSEAEKYANLMYLSNQLSHVFNENSNGKIAGLNNYKTNHIKRELMKIKDWCIHRLIEQKMKGEPIDIAVSTDSAQSHNSGRISFSLPNYFEPFIVHYDSSILSARELKVCDGTERYISKGLKTTFPQYLTDKKMELLERLYNLKSSDSREQKHTETKRLEWLFETKEILKSLERKEIKNSPSKESKEIVATKKEGQNEPVTKEPTVNTSTDTPEEIETVLRLNDEIMRVNQEISELTTAIQQSSNKLALLQSKLLELQSQMQQALHNSTGTHEEKGDR